MSTRTQKVLDFVEKDMSYTDYYLTLITIGLFVTAIVSWSAAWLALFTGGAIGLVVRLLVQHYRWGRNPR